MKKYFKLMSVVFFLIIQTVSIFASHDQETLKQAEKKYSTDSLICNNATDQDISSPQKKIGIIHAKERSKKEIDLQEKHEARVAARKLAQAIADEQEMSALGDVN